MAKCRVRVSTGEACGAGTWDKVSVSIVGTHGESPLVPLDHLGKEFSAGAVSFWGAGNGDCGGRQPRGTILSILNNPS
jgi:hypothetical protein